MMWPRTSIIAAALAGSVSAQLLWNTGIRHLDIAAGSHATHPGQQSRLSGTRARDHTAPLFKAGQFSIGTQDNATCPTYGESQWTGTVDVSDTHRLFFWFFESRHDPSNDPVIIWMNGGPGGSSMYGLFNDLGPCILDGTNLSTNPWAWNNNASLIFLDQPAGVGFGSLAEAAHMPASDMDGAADFQAFLNIFFGKIFPEKAHLPMHVASESYGGHYGPVYLKHILDSRAYDSKSAFWGNITSLVLVSGMVDWTAGAVGTYELLCSDYRGREFLNSTACDKIRSATIEVERLGRLCDLSQDGHECFALHSFFMDQIDIYYRELIEMGKKSPFNIHLPCPDLPFCYPGKAEFTWYLNQDHIKSALGFPTSFTFEAVNLELHQAYEDSRTMLKPTTGEIATVLDAYKTPGLGDIRVLVLNGNEDYIVNTPGQKWIYDKLPWSGQPDYRIAKWTALPEGLAATGFWKGTRDGRLVFVGVDGVGHTVLGDAREGSQRILQRWFEGGWRQE
ncbi:hypothetical protein JDV02_005240 [Purpureocillium takamizusanense]|uniref:Carboxypeptidase n=1 Tax=Purpureocillium takamizusanense TaxID=2060973 RepID=A0A9Q8QHK5_9HYPO|nr:uncharacterized protein JDV02_005240 [Purpureocillium takamizusanense]UNI19021.1 hypothetical protein JDV02_005240 [Purpureocillium takamizusanense]